MRRVEKGTTFVSSGVCALSPEDKIGPTISQKFNVIAGLISPVGPAFDQFLAEIEPRKLKKKGGNLCELDLTV